MKRVFVAMLVVILIPGFTFAGEAEPTESVWSSVVAWVSDLVAEVISPEETAQGAEDEETDPASLWGTIDPVG